MELHFRILYSRYLLNNQRNIMIFYYKYRLLSSIIGEDFIKISLVESELLKKYAPLRNWAFFGFTREKFLYNG